MTTLPALHIMFGHIVLCSRVVLSGTIFSSGIAIYTRFSEKIIIGLASARDLQDIKTLLRQFTFPKRMALLARQPQPHSMSHSRVPEEFLSMHSFYTTKDNGLDFKFVHCNKNCSNCWYFPEFLPIPTYLASMNLNKLGDNRCNKVPFRLAHCMKDSKTQFLCSAGLLASVTADGSSGEQAFLHSLKQTSGNVAICSASAPPQWLVQVANQLSIPIFDLNLPKAWEISDTRADFLQMLQRESPVGSVQPWIDIVTRMLQAVALVSDLLLCHTSVVLYDHTLSKADSQLAKFGRHDIVRILSTVVQIVVHGDYRSILGFVKLINVEWFHFKYPFADDVYEKNRSPKSKLIPDGAFELCMECIIQILKMQPDTFAFHGHFLVDFLDACYSARFRAFVLSSCISVDWSVDLLFWNFVLMLSSKQANKKYAESGSFKHTNENVKKYRKKLGSLYSLFQSTQQGLSSKKATRTRSQSFVLNQSAIVEDISQYATALFVMFDSCCFWVSYYGRLRRAITFSHCDLSHKLFTARIMGGTLQLSAQGLLDCPLRKTNVVSLDASVNHLFALPDGIPRQLNLRYLKLSRNRIGFLSAQSLSNIGKNCLSLTDVDLSFNSIKEIPFEFASILSLTTVNLSHNKLADIPECLSNLINLTDLDISSNNIVGKQIPHSLLFVKNLDLSHNKFVFLEGQAWKGGNAIQQLIMSHNQMKVLPKNITLERLVMLQGSRLEMETLDGIHLFAPALSKMDFSHNNISNLPDQILKLKSLTDVNLSYNPRLESITSSLCLLPLRSLDVSYCGLVSLPTEFQSLSELQELNLSNNRLDTLRFGIHSLKNLVELYLHSNSLRTLPAGFAELNNLKYLTIHNNPLHSTSLTEKLMKIRQPHDWVKSPQAIDVASIVLPHMRDLKLGTQPCHRLLVMLIGETDTGKTVIIQHLSGTSATGQASKVKNQTKAIEVSEVHFQTENILNTPRKQRLTRRSSTLESPDKFLLNLTIWNWAAQEYGFRAGEFFFSPRSIYVIVYSVTKSVADSSINVIRHIRHICHEAGRTQSFIVVVGSHCDRVDSDVPRKKQDEMKAIVTDYVIGKNVMVRYILVRADQEKGYNKLKRKLVKMALRHPLLREIVPSAILSLEQKLKTFKQPVVKFDELTKMAIAEHFHDNRDLFRAIELLRELGTVAYLGDSGAAKDFVVLDANWLITSIRSVLSKLSEQLISQPSSLALILSVIKSVVPHEVAPDKLLSILKECGVLSMSSADTHPSIIHVPSLTVIDIPPDAIAAWNSPIKMIQATSVEENDGKLKGTRLDRSKSDSKMPYTFSTPSQTFSVKSSILEVGRLFKADYIPDKIFTNLIPAVAPLGSQVICYWRNGIIIEVFESFISNLTAGYDLHPSDSISRYANSVKVFLEFDAARTMLAVRCRTSSGKPFVPMNILVILNMRLREMQVDYEELIPCTSCLHSGIPDWHSYPQLFPKRILENQFVQAGASDFQVHCINCGGNPTASDLAPDIVVATQQSPIVPSNQLGDMKLMTRGSAGKVWTAVYREKLVVLKGVDTPGMLEDKSIVILDEIRREGYYLSRFRHSNVIAMLGYLLKPCIGIVLEHAPGGSLFQCLSNASFKLAWALRMKIAFDVACAMKYLHSQDPPILHRDLKSPNVLIMHANPNAYSSTVAKLADFGHAGPPSLYSTVPIDNPCWLAPEVLLHKGFSTASDVYAYGVILWELVSRNRPFNDFRFNHEIHDAVVAAVRPTIPSGTDVSMVLLIKQCWNQNIPVRPKFSQIVRRLLHIVETVMPKSQANRLTVRFHRQLPDLSLDEEHESAQESGRDWENLQRLAFMRLSEDQINTNHEIVSSTRSKSQSQVNVSKRVSVPKGSLRFENESDSQQSNSYHSSLSGGQETASATDTSVPVDDKKLRSTSSHSELPVSEPRNRVRIALSSGDVGILFGGSDLMHQVSDLKPAPPSPVPTMMSVDSTDNRTLGSTTEDFSDMRSVTSHDTDLMSTITDAFAFAPMEPSTEPRRAKVTDTKVFCKSNLGKSLVKKQ